MSSQELTQVSSMPSNQSQTSNFSTGEIWIYSYNPSHNRLFEVTTLRNPSGLKEMKLTEQGGVLLVNGNDEALMLESGKVVQLKTRVSSAYIHQKILWTVDSDTLNLSCMEEAELKVVS